MLPDLHIISVIFSPRRQKSIKPTQQAAKNPMRPGHVKTASIGYTQISAWNAIHKILKLHIIASCHIHQKSHTNTYDTIHKIQEIKEKYLQIFSRIKLENSVYNLGFYMDFCDDTKNRALLSTHHIVLQHSEAIVSYFSSYCKEVKRPNRKQHYMKKTRRLCVLSNTKLYH